MTKPIYAKVQLSLWSEVNKIRKREHLTWVHIISAALRLWLRGRA